MTGSLGVSVLYHSLGIGDLTAVLPKQSVIVIVIDGKVNLFTLPKCIDSEN